MKRPLPLVGNQQVKVYRNLQAKCLSVMERGKVTGHAQTVRLTDVKFQVSDKGRERCICRQRKTVHAFVVGNLEEAVAEVLAFSGTKVSYNPYKAGYFYNAATGEPVYQAKSVVITPNGVFVEE
jgi:hypothetical protein